jgi:RNA polymerase sigma factor (sigma-70 family)
MIALATPSNHADTAQLIESCLRGEQSAWDTLVDRFGRLVYSVAHNYGLCEADADDVFQNVFAKLHRRLASIRNPQSLPSWFITTTHRECWDLSRKRREKFELSNEAEDPADPSPVLADRWEQQQIVREAVGRLSPREQALMDALFLQPEPMQYAELARRLGVKSGSIGPSRARCFKKLEKILVELGIDAFIDHDHDQKKASPADCASVAYAYVA